MYDASIVGKNLNGSRSPVHCYWPVYSDQDCPVAGIFDTVDRKQSL